MMTCFKAVAMRMTVTGTYDSLTRLTDSLPSVPKSEHK